MSIEIKGNDVNVSEELIIELNYEKNLIDISFDKTAECDWVCLDKKELARLIAALQAMHDKMVDA